MLESLPKNKLQIRTIVTINFLIQIISRILNGGILLLSAKLLTKSDFADYVVFQALVIIWSSIGSASLVNIILSRPTTKNDIQLLHYVSASVLFIFFIVTTSAILNQFITIYKFSLVYGVFCAVFLSLHAIYTSYLQKNLKYSRLILYSALQLILTVVLAVFPVLNTKCRTLEYFIISYTISYFGVVLFLIFNSKLVFSSLFSLQKLKEVSLESRWYSFYFGFLIIGAQCDVVITKNVMSDFETAEYAISYRIFSLCSIASSAIATTLLPHFSSLNSIDAVNDYLNKYVLKSAPVSFILYLISVGLLFLFQNNLPYLARHQTAVNIIKVFGLAIMVGVVVNPVVNLYLCAEKIRYLCFVNLIIVILSIPMKIVSLKCFGTIGLAFAASISTVSLPLFLYIINKSSVTFKTKTG